MEGMEVCKLEKRFGIRYLRDVGVVYYDRLEKQTPDGRNIYGVRVTLHSTDGEETESCYISECQEDADRLLERLRRGGVTPCTLLEIMDEQVF